MSYQPSFLAIVIFSGFVALTLGLGFVLGRRAKSAAGYFAAHGQIPWFVNGVAFAGDYLSAASFLGICGMIAFYGYDGFLYSIGYLAGWIVALFVIAEPMKRLGKFTFADALNARFQSRGIKIAAGLSTLAVSVFYLIPQMVGAGVLVQPLLGMPHWAGVLLVGATVVTIVVTAGMVSTTWVQFIKGALLVIFSTLLTVMIFADGLKTDRGHAFRTLGPFESDEVPDTFDGFEMIPPTGAWADTAFVRLRESATGRESVWNQHRESPDAIVLLETQTITRMTDGQVLINGESNETSELHPVGRISKLPDGVEETGPLGPISFLQTLEESEVILWGSEIVREADGTTTTVYYQKPTPGSEMLLPGNHPTFRGLREGNFLDRLNFVSLMLALFCGTAALPHILIRYYTVKDEVSARRSTIVGIACISFFYVLTLYMGLGAMVSGTLDVSNSNMSAPLLARGMSDWLFASISAIAFTTVLGTVSGLILASAGAVTHDLISTGFGVELTDTEKVRVAKIGAVVVGGIAIVLGILFAQLNVSYLVGWAFSVAASANLPSLVLALFWRGTTRYGVIAAVVVGMVGSLGWILLSGDTYAAVYGLSADSALVPFSQPGIVTIPLGFVTLVVVSLLTRERPHAAEPLAEVP